jgi:hypothetical protein
MNVDVNCPCGTVFSVPEHRVRAGRGKRCSKACQYQYATRPSGLTYEIKRENPTSFKSGNRPWNTGTRGLIVAWNKGVPTGVVPPNAFKPGQHNGPANNKWKGDNVGYGALHSWVARSKAKTGTCTRCGRRAKTEWANLSHEYRRDVNDFEEMCHRCHVSYDRASGTWGLATRWIKEGVK